MRLSTKIFIGFALIIAFSVGGSFVDFKLSNEVHRNTEFLTYSETVIRNSVSLHKTIIEMQSAFRGYLLTANENFLTSFNTGIIAAPVIFKEQKKLLANSPSKLEKLKAIEVLHIRWIDYSNQLIAAKKNEQTSEEYRFLFENKLQKEFGQKLNNEISILFKAFDKDEYRLREERRKNLAESIRNTQAISLILMFIVAGIGLAGAVYITQLISKRIFTMVTLADRISKGDFEIIHDRADDELTQLSISLNIMSSALQKNISDLEKKNKELDQFAYVVSHDLKAPLRGMYNVFTWIEEDLGSELPESLKRYHEILKDRIYRLERLITGLLDYARIGKTISTHETVNVNELVQSVAEMVVPPRFNFTIRDTLPITTTDRISLEQVFSNLISNAVKFNSDERASIEVTYKELASFHEFSITDNGIGIAPEYHEKIFTIFQTLREKNQKESTGIGLAIVKKIIDENKGKIRVNSNVGKGASFIFTWPK
jgi:signal transduction histidine kinase